MDKPEEAERKDESHIASLPSELINNILSQLRLRDKMTFHMTSKIWLSKIDESKYKILPDIHKSEKIFQYHAQYTKNRSQFLHLIETQNYDLVKLFIDEFNISVDEEDVITAVNTGNLDIFKIVYTSYVDKISRIHKVEKYLNSLYEDAYKKAEELHGLGSGYKAIYDYLLDEGIRYLITHVIKFSLRDKSINFIVNLLNKHHDEYAKYTVNYYEFLNRLFMELFDVITTENGDSLVDLVDAMRKLGYTNIPGTLELGISYVSPGLAMSVIHELNSEEIRRGLDYLVKNINFREKLLRDKYVEIGNMLINKLILLGDIKHDDWVNILILGAVLQDINIVNMALGGEKNYTSNEIYSAYEKLLLYYMNPDIFIPDNLPLTYALYKPTDLYYSFDYVDCAINLLQELKEEEVGTKIKDVTKILLKLVIDADRRVNFANYVVERKIIDANELLLIGVDSSSLEVVKLALKIGADNIDEAYKLDSVTGHSNMARILLNSGKVKDVNFVLTHGTKKLWVDVVKWALDHGADNVDENICYLYENYWDVGKSVVAHYILYPLLDLFVNSNWSNVECLLGLAMFNLYNELVKSILSERVIPKESLQNIYNDILAYIDENKSKNKGTRFDTGEGREILQIIRERLYN